jgi:hypothetical protein
LNHEHQFWSRKIENVAKVQAQYKILLTTVWLRLKVDDLADSANARPLVAILVIHHDADFSVALPCLVEELAVAHLKNVKRDDCSRVQNHS